MYEYTRTILSAWDYLEYCLGLNVIDHDLYDYRRSYLISTSLYGYGEYLNGYGDVLQERNEYNKAILKITETLKGWQEQDLDKSEEKA